MALLANKQRIRLRKPAVGPILQIQSIVWIIVGVRAFNSGQCKIQTVGSCDRKELFMPAYFPLTAAHYYASS